MNYFGLTTIDDLPNVDELFQMQDNESFDLFDFPADEDTDNQLAFFKKDSIISEQE